MLDAFFNFLSSINPFSQVFSLLRLVIVVIAIIIVLWMMNVSVTKWIGMSA